MKIIIAALLVPALIIMSCAKNNDDTNTTAQVQDQIQVDYKKANDATNIIVEQHKNPSNGHSLCYAQELIYHNCDSLFSSHYYQYCQNIYSQYGNGYQVYNWNMHDGEEHGMCGLDTIYYQNHTSTLRDFHLTDSLMCQKMKSYQMDQYLSTSIKDCYQKMQFLRNTHTQVHNLHY